MNHQKLTSTRPSSFIARLCKTEVKGKENLTLPIRSTRKLWPSWQATFAKPSRTRFKGVKLTFAQIVPQL